MYLDITSIADSDLFKILPIKVDKHPKSWVKVSLKKMCMSIATWSFLEHPV